MWEKKFSIISNNIFTHIVGVKAEGQSQNRPFFEIGPFALTTGKRADLKKLIFEKGIRANLKNSFEIGPFAVTQTQVNLGGWPLCLSQKSTF